MSPFVLTPGAEMAVGESEGQQLFQAQQALPAAGHFQSLGPGLRRVNYQDATPLRFATNRLGGLMSGGQFDERAGMGICHADSGWLGFPNQQ